MAAAPAATSSVRREGRGQNRHSKKTASADAAISGTTGAADRARSRTAPRQAHARGRPARVRPPLPSRRPPRRRQARQAPRARRRGPRCRRARTAARPGVRPRGHQRELREERGGSRHRHHARGERERERVAQKARKAHRQRLHPRAEQPREQHDAERGARREANETETAVWGDVATSAMTHSESALSGAGRRRAKQADMPANAMHAARTAETGAAANTR